MNKYKILKDQYIEVIGKKLYRVQALKDFDGVKAGDTGGYIESESNLSQYDNAWVSDDAWVYGDARVCDDAWVHGNARVFGNAQVSDDARVSDNAQVHGNAQVFGNAQVHDNAQVFVNAWVHGNARVFGNAQVSDDARVSDNAQVYGNAWVHGNAQVFGNAWVYGNAQVFGNAWVYGTRHYLNLGPIGSRYGYTTIYRDKNKKAIVVCGCFHGDLDEFERAVHKTHAGTKYEAEYMALIQLARLREKEWLDEVD